MPLAASRKAISSNVRTSRIACSSTGRKPNSAATFRAIALWIQGSADASLRELASIPLDQLPTSYYHLRGRVAWTKAMAFETASAFDRARTELEAARELFRRAGELEYDSVNAFY